MSETLGVVILVLLVVAVLAGRFAYYRISYMINRKIQTGLVRRRERKAREESRAMVDSLGPDDDDSCVACDSKSLERPGPGIYRCRDCGYEGGSAKAAGDTDRIREQWMSVPVAERRKAALEDLMAARRTLDEEMIGKQGLSVGAVLSHHAHYELAEEQLQASTSILRRAGRLMHDANLKLSGLGILDEETDYMAIATDVLPKDQGVLQQRLQREAEEAIATLTSMAG